MKAIRLFPLTCIFIVLLFPTTVFSQDTTVVYEADSSLFANPERGFYHHTETHSTGYSPLNAGTLAGYRTNEGISLILRVFYLEDFKTTLISSAYLNLIQQDLDAVRAAGLKCIVRFAYTDSQGPDDASKSIIFQHLDQLQPIFENNADVIAVVQAGFIGSWGEWYYTTQAEFGIPPAPPNYTNRGQVLAKIHSVLPQSRMVMVRTPEFKKNIFGTTLPLSAVQAHTGTDFARTGHHNDCFLASSDDYGTYVNVTADKNYLSQDCQYVPNGGETCNPSAYSGCTNALSDLSFLHYSFLNTDYHPAVLNGWITGGCMDEVKKNLGYRFRLLEGQFSNPVASGDSFHVMLKLVNEGWAAPFNPRGVEIILRSVSVPSQLYKFPMPDDPRFWLAGDTSILDRTLPLPPNLPPDRYEVLLSLPDTASSLNISPEYAIRLANRDVWEASTGYNDLHFQLTLSVPDGMNGQCQYNPGFRIFPNPNDGTYWLEYELSPPKTAELNIYDVTGRKAGHHILKNDGNRLRIDDTNLGKGIYFYNVIAGSERVKSGRMIIR